MYLSHLHVQAVEVQVWAIVEKFAHWRSRIAAYDICALTCVPSHGTGCINGVSMGAVAIPQVSDVTFSTAGGACSGQLDSARDHPFPFPPSHNLSDSKRSIHHHGPRLHKVMNIDVDSAHALLKDVSDSISLCTSCNALSVCM